MFAGTASDRWSLKVSDLYFQLKKTGISALFVVVPIEEVSSPYQPPNSERACWEGCDWGTLEQKAEVPNTTSCALGPGVGKDACPMICGALWPHSYLQGSGHFGGNCCFSGAVFVVFLFGWFFVFCLFWCGFFFCRAESMSFLHAFPVTLTPSLSWGLHQEIRVCPAGFFCLRERCLWIAFSGEHGWICLTSHRPQSMWGAVIYQWGDARRAGCLRGEGDTWSCWEVVTPCGAEDTSTAAPAWIWQEERGSKAQPSPVAR